MSSGPIGFQDGKEACFSGGCRADAVGDAASLLCRQTLAKRWLRTAYGPLRCHSRRAEGVRRDRLLCLSCVHLPFLEFYPLVSASAPTTHFPKRSRLPAQPGGRQE